MSENQHGGDGDNSRERSGAYRQRAFEAHGKQCAECGWEPKSDIEEAKLHVHHVVPINEGGLGDASNLRPLCRDCHLDKHSDSAFRNSLVGRLTDAFSAELAHKTDGFKDRVSNRVHRDTVSKSPEKPDHGNLPDRGEQAGCYIVEGVLDGDNYDFYYVDRHNPHLGMCTCYQHGFGTLRAEEICTHVGAAVVREAIAVADDEGEDEALRFIREIGEEMNESASQYVERSDLVTKGIDTLDIDERFSDHYADRARRQSRYMTRWDNEWHVFGGECEGCDIRLTADGYCCNDEDWGTKWPCPGKLAAHVMDAAETRREQPDIDEGQAFSIKKTVDAFGADEGDIVIVRSIDGGERMMTFDRIEGDGTVGVSASTTVSFGEVVDAILGNKLSSIERDSVGDIRFEEPVETPYGPKVPIDSPKDAKEDIRDLNSNYRATWDSKQGRWLIDPRYIRSAASKLSNDGWFVYLPESVAQAADGLGDDITTEMVELEEAEVALEEVVDGWVAIRSPIEAKDDIKAVSKKGIDRKWDPERRRWLVPKDTVTRVADHLREEGWDVRVAPSVKDASSNDNDSEDTDVADGDIIVDGTVEMIEGDDGNLTYTDSSQAEDTVKAVTLDTPYDARDDLLDLDKETTGRRWVPELEHWVVKADALPDVIQQLEDAGWTVGVLETANSG